MYNLFIQYTLYSMAHRGMQHAAGSSPGGTNKATGRVWINQPSMEHLGARWTTSEACWRKTTLTLPFSGNVSDLIYIIHVLYCLVWSWFFVYQWLLSGVDRCRLFIMAACNLKNGLDCNTRSRFRCLLQVKVKEFSYESARD